MGGVRKAFLDLLGQPTLLHALLPFLAETRVVAVVVALAPEDASSPPSWLLELAPRVLVVAGGATRSQSVRSAIAALPEDLDAIAVHDAARPLITLRVVAECLDLALEGFGAVAGCPAVDTLKRVDTQGFVLDTPDRASFWHAQMPQVFPAGVLRAAYADPRAEGTDDSALVERTGSGVRVKLVDAGPSNLKVTRPEDVSVAEAILRRRAER
jgi:2-C-methyl-D-erythritol 4-phosphate cytidylyltransferase